MLIKGKSLYTVFLSSTEEMMNCFSQILWHYGFLDVLGFFEQIQIKLGSVPMIFDGLRGCEGAVIEVSY